MKNATRLILSTCFILMANMFFAQASKQRPNIIVIISDDHTSQAIGAYGAKYKVTPNIDKLASEGMLFQMHMLPMLFVVLVERYF